MRIAKCAAVLAVFPLLTAASEPIYLQPTSKWVLDYADDSCRLLRTFGTADDQSVLVIERVAPNAPMSMLIVSRYLKSTIGARDFTARFLPHEKARSTNGQSATADGRKSAVLWPYVSFGNSFDEKDADLPPAARTALASLKKGERPPPPSPEEAAKFKAEVERNAATTTGIEVTRKGMGRTLVLNSGPMGKANTMLRQCSRDQLAHWGIDPKVDEQIARPVNAIDPMKWFSMADYPMDSLRKAQESQLQVRALIDAEGKITKCTPVTRVAATDFPEKVCQVMQRRAKFEPAELADGTKVPSYYIQTIRFRIQ